MRIGYATKQIVQTILGSWIFVLLFRRPLLALLSDVFHEGEKLGQNEVFRLSTGAKHELLLLVLWAPFAFTNLRAKPSERIFCSDASLEGAGVCSAHFGKGATLSLARQAEQRGYYTRVDTSTLGQYEALHKDGIWEEMTIPRALQEGFLFDFCEVIRGCGKLSSAHKHLGMRVHPGFVGPGSLDCSLQDRSTFLALVGLICRRVVRAFHVAPNGKTFGTLKRPRVRSKQEPLGFQPDEESTFEDNLFAYRVAYVLHLCSYYGLIATAEQLQGSVMFKLDIFQRLLAQGFSSVFFSYCSWGAPFKKQSWWISNNPEMQALSTPCRCGYRGRHFRVQGSFDKQGVAIFESMCRPNSQVVFGRSPHEGESVTSFCCMYPLAFCSTVAELNLKHMLSDRPREDLPRKRPSHQSPAWVSDLGRSLEWRKLLQFRFRKLNHININESLAFRSLIKHLAKEEPSSRFVALLYSKVVINSTSKGRSSSKQLNFYLASSLPFIVGGDL